MTLRNGIHRPVRVDELTISAEAVRLAGKESLAARMVLQEKLRKRQEEEAKRRAMMWTSEKGMSVKALTAAAQLIRNASIQQVRVEQTNDGEPRFIKVKKLRSDRLAKDYERKKLENDFSLFNAAGLNRKIRGGKALQAHAANVLQLAARKRILWRKAKAAMLIQCCIRRKYARKHVKDLLLKKLNMKAALCIQSQVRRRRARKRFEHQRQVRAHTRAAVCIQNQLRRLTARKRYEEVRRKRASFYG